MPRTHTSGAFQLVGFKSTVSAISYSASLRPDFLIMASTTGWNCAYSGGIGLSSRM